MRVVEDLESIYKIEITDLYLGDMEGLAEKE